MTTREKEKENGPQGIAAQIVKLRKVATCIYIAVEKTVADDVSKTCLEAASTLEALASALTEAQAERDSWQERYLDKKKDFEKQAINWAVDQSRLSVLEAALAEAQQELSRYHADLMRENVAKLEAQQERDALIEAHVRAVCTCGGDLPSRQEEG